ncbi:MAG: polyamine aminopropyltransferase [Chitinispirillaceae bacterium]
MAESSKRLFKEPLNDNFGFYYTIDKSLYKGRTKFQEIEMVETAEFGTTLLLDNITQVVEKNEWQYHEPMVHPAMCSHPNPRNVLVIGGGDGGILREVLKYPSVEHVDFAELDSEVVEFSRKYLFKMNENSFDDPRVSVQITDGRSWVEQHPGQYDIVIMDMTDPFGPSKFLYTKQFFTAIKRSFRNAKGLFVMHSESPISRPVAFNCIVRTLRSVFKNVTPLYTYIQMYAVLWSMCVSSDGIAIANKTAPSINKRLSTYGIKKLKVFTGESLVAMRTPYPYIEEILKRRVRLITDKNPDFPDNFIK